MLEVVGCQGGCGSVKAQVVEVGLQLDCPAQDVWGELLTCQVRASASFSIWAYRVLAFVMDLDALAAVRHPCDVCWSNTAPRPCDEASAETLVGPLGCTWSKHRVWPSLP